MGLVWGPAKQPLPFLTLLFPKRKTKATVRRLGSDELGLLTAPGTLGRGEASWSGAGSSPAAAAMG